MRSNGQIVADLQTLSGDDSSANKTLLQTLVNQTDKLVLGIKPWPFLDARQTYTTTADQTEQQLPALCRKVISVRIDDTNFPPPRPVEDPNFWEYLQSLNTGSSDIMEFYYAHGGVVEFFPAIASASQTLVVRFRKTRKDMSQDDYTTGTITSIANGATTVTGSGTTWSAKFAGRWIKFSGDNGDDKWYEIASRTSNTAVELTKKYEGTSIAAATDAYRIGEMSLIPGDYHDALLWRPLAIFFDMHEQTGRAQHFWRLFDGGKEAGLVPGNAPIGGIVGHMLQEMSESDEGPYIAPPYSYDHRNINDPPTNLTGF